MGLNKEFDAPFVQVTNHIVYPMFPYGIAEQILGNTQKLFRLIRGYLNFFTALFRDPVPGDDDISLLS